MKENADVSKSREHWLTGACFITLLLFSCGPQQPQSDGGTSDRDAGLDAGFDAGGGTSDAGADAGLDGGSSDAGLLDAGLRDGGSLSTAPNSPTGLTATGTNATVSLTWQPSSGALDYVLMRSLDSGGPYTEVASTATADFIDTTLVNETEYFYVVHARNDAGVSAASNEAGAAPTAFTAWAIKSWYRTLAAVSYGAGKCIAVGENRFAATSSDCQTNWVLARSTIGAPLAVAAGDDAGFVAVGVSGNIGYSADGISWEGVSSPTGTMLQGVAYGAGRFVAVGANVVVSSADGRTWQQETTNGGSTSIVFGNGAFVAGDLYSTDGTNWINRGGGRSPLAFGNGTFLSVATSSGTVYRSATGATWSSVSLTVPNSGPPYLQAVGHSPGTGFVVGGRNGEVFTSPDAITWTWRGPVGGDWMNMAATPTGLLALTGGLRFTTDGIQWAVVNPSGPIPGGTMVIWDGVQLKYLDALDAAVGGDHGVAVGNGIQWWTPSTGQSGSGIGGASGLYGVAENGGVFVAVGAGGRIFRSTDFGQTWVIRQSGTTNDLTAIAFGAGRFVAVGDQGTIVQSVDGSSWTAVSVQTQESFRRVAFGAGRFVAIGRNGTGQQSSDGLTWSALPFGCADCTVLVFRGGQWLAAGQTVFTSPTGRVWTRRWESPEPIASAEFAGGIWTLLGANRLSATSP